MGRCQWSHSSGYKRNIELGACQSLASGRIRSVDSRHSLHQLLHDYFHSTSAIFAASANEILLRPNTAEVLVEEDLAFNGLFDARILTDRWAAVTVRALGVAGCSFGFTTSLT